LIISYLRLLAGFPARKAFGYKSLKIRGLDPKEYEESANP